MARSFKTVIDKFLGLHECEAGESRLGHGESPRMKNLTVTSDYTLLQRDGWERVAETSGEGRGLFIGKVGKGEETVWVVNGTVYRLKDSGYSEVGELETDSGQLTIFPFDSKLYFLDGKAIKVWDGEVFGDIEPYVPLVAVSCDYLGAGTPFEDVNMLTGSKRQSFTPDGEHGEFQLAEKDIQSVDCVRYNSEVMLSEGYSVDLEKGTVTFMTVPADTTPNCIEITYTKNSNSEKAIHRMRYAVAYGGENDTRIFLWGDSEFSSLVRYSGVHGGVSGFEYFPELNFNKIGLGAAVTSAVRHYDRLMIFTEDEAYQCSGEKSTDISGMEYTVYPIKTVSSETGCAVPDFAKLIDNKPVTLSPSGLYLWSSSTIRDERNAEEIGERIRQGLRSFGTRDVHSFDSPSRSELYIWQGEKVYVYNYALDLFYYYEGFDAAAFQEDCTGRVWFVRRDGTLCRMTDEKLDGGMPMPFLWESGYEESSGLDTKNVHRLEFEIYPISATSFGFVWVSERSTGRYETLEIEYKVADLSNMDFSDLVFTTAVTPVRLHKRIKAKRTRGFKLMIENGAERGDFHLLGISVIGKISDTQ